MENHVKSSPNQSIPGNRHILYGQQLLNQRIIAERRLALRPDIKKAEQSWQKEVARVRSLPRRDTGPYILVGKKQTRRLATYI